MSSSSGAQCWQWAHCGVIKNASRMVFQLSTTEVELCEHVQPLCRQQMSNRQCCSIWWEVRTSKLTGVTHFTGACFNPNPVWTSKLWPHGVRWVRMSHSFAVLFVFVRVQTVTRVFDKPKGFVRVLPRAPVVDSRRVQPNNNHIHLILRHLTVIDNVLLKWCIVVMMGRLSVRQPMTEPSFVRS